MTQITCDACGAVLAMGDWPFCPHGRSTLTVVADDVPGGFVAENGFSEPRRFYSKSAHRAALAAENCEMRPTWRPGDKHLTRWDSVDLDAAKALVTPRPTMPITVTNGESFRERDLDVEPVSVDSYGPQAHLGDEPRAGGAGPRP